MSNIFPHFTTKRLQFRPFKLTDAPAFYALNADPEVMRFVPDPPFVDIPEAESFLKNYLSIYSTGYGRLAVLRRVDDDFVGWCGLKRSPYTENVDLGFRFRRKYWNLGYATEASKRCIQYGFEELGLERIIGRCAGQNFASQRVLEKLGFLLVGPFQEPDWSGYEYELLKA